MISHVFLHVNPAWDEKYQIVYMGNHVTLSVDCADLMFYPESIPIVRDLLRKLEEFYTSKETKDESSPIRAEPIAHSGDLPR